MLRAVDRLSTKEAEFILVALNQAAAGTIGSIQGHSGFVQVYMDVLSTIINPEAGPANWAHNGSNLL